MPYEPDNATAKEPESKFPKDTILEGVITALEDGNVKKFVPNTTNWKDPEQPAIEVAVEVMVDGKSVIHKQVYTYQHGPDGKGMVYGTKSYLAKFKTKYENLPKVGTKVKITTNGDGFGTIKLD